MRDFAILLLVICAVIIVLIVSMQHRPQVEFPLVDAAAPGPDAKSPMLFAPCPLSPHNAVAKAERDA